MARAVTSCRRAATALPESTGSLRVTSSNERPFGKCTARTVVIGLGNEIACDDAVGILAARRLRLRLGPMPQVKVLELPWAGLRLLEAVRGARYAILIDSLQSGKWPVGTVVRLSEHDFAGSVRLHSFHDLNYPSALAFGRALGWHMPARVEIYAVEGEVFDRFGTGLTRAVARGLDEVVDKVAGVISSNLALDHPAGGWEVTHAGGDEN